jgi:hypothetical protein
MMMGVQWMGLVIWPGKHFLGVLQEVVMGWGPFLYGPREMVAVTETAATVMVTQTASIHCQLAVLQKMAMFPGIQKPAPLSWQPPTVAVVVEKGRS